MSSSWLALFCDNGQTGKTWHSMAFHGILVKIFTHVMSFCCFGILRCTSLHDRISPSIRRGFPLSRMTTNN